jgi:hypothetical protein
MTVAALVEAVVFLTIRINAQVKEEKRLGHLFGS